MTASTYFVAPCRPHSVAEGQAKVASLRLRIQITTDAPLRFYQIDIETDVFTPGFEFSPIVKLGPFVLQFQFARSHQATKAGGELLTKDTP